MFARVLKNMSKRLRERTEGLKKKAKFQSFTSRRKKKLKDSVMQKLSEDNRKDTREDPAAICPFAPSFPKDLYMEIFSFLPFEDLLKAAQVSKIWSTTADRIASWDIVFVCDITGSMSCWNEIVRCVSSIMETYSHKRIRYGFVGYTDHDGDSSLTVSKPLSFRPSEVASFIQKLVPKGGGDYPEAVMDGLNEGLKMPWRNGAKKIIVLFCDAPPHGSQFGGGGDAHPNGCPCGLTERIILDEMKQKKINFTILNVTSEEALAPMLSIFKQIMPELSTAKATKNDLMDRLTHVMDSVLQTSPHIPAPSSE